MAKDAIRALRDILATNWSKPPKPSIEDIADVDKGDAKRVRLLENDVIRIFETAHNEAQPELVYDFVNEHVNITIDCRTVTSRERLSELRNEVRRIVQAFRKGDNTNFDRLIYKTRTDLSDRSKKLFRYTIQVEVITFSLVAGADDPVVNPADGSVVGSNVYQTLDGDLTALANLTPSDSVFIVGSGTSPGTWVAESGATARASLGLGSMATQASDNVSITGGSLSGISGLVSSITAGTGITGNATDGAVTLNVGGLTVSELAANSIQLSNESFADNDTSIMTSAAILDKIQSEISALVDSAPDALNTLNELAAAVNDDASFASTITTSIGTKLAKASNLSDLANAGTARTNLGLGSLATLSSVAFSNLADAAVQTSGEAFADNDTTLMTSAAIQDKILSYGFTTETGDITGVAAGTGLSGGGTSGDVTLTIDMSEYSQVTPASGDTFLTLDSDGSTEQLTTVDALATLLAGTNLSASNGVLSSTDTNTFRTVTAGGNTLGASETLAFTAGTNVTITESGGAVTIASTDTNTQLTLLDEDNMSSNSATAAASQQSIKAYVDAEVAGVVDSAPGALDTLNELAAAINDDASFSSTVTTALGNRLRVDVDSQSLNSTQQGNALTNLGITASLAEINILDDGLSASDIPNLATSKITSGTFTDGRIAESNVTQHLAVGSGGGIGLSGKTFTLDIDGMTDINAALVDTDLMIVDDGANGTNRKATMSRLKTYMQNNLTFTTDTNTFRTITAGGNTLGATETLAFTAGSNVTITESGGAVTIASSNAALSSEEVQDIVGAMVDGGTETNISVTYDDTSGKLSFVSTDTNTQLTQEQVEDFVAGVITAGANITKTYDDAAGTLTIASTDTNTQLTQEQVEDFVGGMLDGTETFISVSYDDTDGNIDFVVPVKDEDDFASNSDAFLATQQSIKAYVDGKTASIVDSAPAALDTLNELAAALNDDASFSTTTATSLGNRLRVDDNQSLTGTQQAQGRTNLGLGSISLLSSIDISSNTNLAVSSPITLSGDTVGLDDPANLSELDESTDATDDKILLWDESASSWKYMTLDNLQDAIDTTATGGAGEAFKTISVSGQSDVVADAAADTLTFAEGSNVTITTNASNDTITFASTDTNTFRTVTAGGNTLGSGETLAFTAGTGITISESGGAVTITNSVSDTNTFRTVTAGGNTLGSSETLAFTAGSNVTITESGGAVTIASADTNTQLSQEQVEDFVAGVITAGSNITKTYDDAAGTLTLAATDTNTQLTTEQVQDIAGPLVATGGTKTRISITYDDTNNDMDFVVDDMNFSVSDITGATELSSGLASTDELVLSDAGTLKRMDVSVLQAYMQSNLTFTTDTNTQLSQENVEDFVGGMLDGTETFISVSYDDTDGNLDFVVPVLDEDNMASNSASHLATQQSIKSYVDAELTSLVDSAPAALNTLNELAAALGDDASFSTTTATSLGNRLRVDVSNQGLTGTQQGNALTNLGITASLAEINILDDGLSASDIPDLAASKITSGTLGADRIPSLATSKITSGTFDDARIAESNVTQHLAVGSGGGIGLSGKTFTLDIDGMTDINAALVDADLFIVDDGAGGTNRKATMSRLKTYMQNNLTFTSDTNTNQLTTFTLTGDSGSNQTIAHGNTLDIAGGGGIATVVGATDTVTVSLDDPANLSELDESSDATDDKILLWDESASSWKYMTLDNLQDSIDTTGGGGSVRTVTAGGNTLASSETLAFTAGTGISISESGGAVTITNSVTDTNTFRTVTAGGNTLGATETLAFTAGTGISIGESGGTVTITNSAATRPVTAGGNTLASNETLAFTAGSNVTITESGGAVTIASTDTNTQLSTENVQDIAGPLVASGGTKTRISVTYDDTNNNMDFVVDDMNFSVSDITGATALTSGLASTDELVLSDAGTLKRMDVSVLEAYMQSNLSFTNNDGDITGVTAGTGLSGGGSSGGVTLNVSGLTVDEFAANSIQLSSESFANNDTSIMTSAAIEDKILSYGYTTNTGDITGVTAGTGLSGGGSSGGVTLNVDLKDEDDMSSNSATHAASQQSIKAYVDAEVAGIVDSAPTALNTLNELAAALNDDASFSTTITTSIGTKLAKSSNLSDLANAATARTNLGLGTGAVLDTAAIADGGSGLATADQIHTFVTSFGYTTNTGDITAVVAGTGLSGGATSGSATLNVSGLTVSEFAANSIQLSSESFSNNDTSIMTSAAIEDKILSYGYTTNTGDITGVDLTGGTGVTIGSETNTGSGAYSSTISIGQAVATSDDVTFSTVTIASDLIHSGDTNNKIAFGTDTQSFQTGGTARFNISDSGLQIGSGERVTTILDEDNMASDSATALATQQSIKAYVDAEVTGAGGASALNDLSDVTYSSGDLTISSLDTLVVGGFTIDSSGDLTFDAAGDQIYFKDAGSTRFQFNLDSTPEIDVTGNFTIDGSGDISLDAGSPTWRYKSAGTEYFRIAMISSGDIVLQNVTQDKDIYIRGDNGGVTTDFLVFDASDSGKATFSGNLAIPGFVLDGNTITGVDDSGEFTNNDNHIMTSAAIEDKILGYGYTTNTGDITGVDLTVTSPITITSETNTTSGSYSATLGLDDPANLSQLTESTDATTDKILLWDESASSWKYMTLDDLQDSIDTTGGGGASALNDLSDVTYSSGDLTISSLDTLVVGDFTIDSSGDISLDADGADIRLKDAGTTYANLAHDSGHFKIKAVVNDADMYFMVKDNNSNVNALILDGSAAGAATFNAGVTIGGNLDTNSQNIIIDDNHGILDDSSNEQLLFGKTTSANAYIKIWNGISDTTGGTLFGTDVVHNSYNTAGAGRITGPGFEATGDETDVGMSFKTKGLGQFVFTNTDSSAEAAPVLNIMRNTADTEVSDDDDIGMIKFSGADSSMLEVGSETAIHDLRDYARIGVEVPDQTSGNADGEMYISILVKDSQRRLLAVGSNNLAHGDTPAAGVAAKAGQVRTFSGNQALDYDDYAGLYLIATSALTFTLPANPNRGEQYVIISDTTGTVTIDRNGNTINGASSNATITTRYEAKTFIATSSSAYIMLG